MNIARIVSSQSHVQYVARIIDQFDANEFPEPHDYGFGTFVGIPIESGNEIIGVIYDSLIVNPEYANFGPRLSPAEDLKQFSADFLSEQGVLVRILLLGTMTADGNVAQRVPPRVVLPGTSVGRLDSEQFNAFHRDRDGALQLHYYPQVMAHAGSFAIPLLDEIIASLLAVAGDDDQRRLEVLRQTLAWQRTLAGSRL